jgi:hypothetical protein
MKYLYVHDQQKLGRLKVYKIDTADLLTKQVKWELAELVVLFMLGSALVFSR